MEATLDLTPPTFTRYNTNLEVLGGIRYTFLNRIALGAAAGPGLTSGIGTPDVRVVATLGWGHEFCPPKQDPEPEPLVMAPPPPPPPPASQPETQPAPASEPLPPSDRDSDGIFDTDDACPDQAGSPSPNPKQNGCPSGAIVADQIVALEPIRFKYGSDKILKKSDTILQTVLATITHLPEGTRIRAEGHTDNRGSAKLNRKLSLARAKSVVRWMAAHGIAADRFDAKGFGPARPLMGNDTSPGREINRRVEFLPRQMIRRLLMHRSRLVTLLLLAACEKKIASPALSTNAPLEQAQLVNGGFESNAVATVPSSWAVATYLNHGVKGSSSAPPASFASLNLGAAGAGKSETFVVGDPTVPPVPLSQVDPDLGPGQSFRYPIYGGRATRVNYLSPTDYGKDQNANSMSQTMTMAATDVDPTDGLMHVRFAVAPVLENPGHGYDQQPYFYVELLNLTQGTTLYTAFNTAGQSGVPWHTTTGVLTHNAPQWLDWQLVDIPSTGAALAVGDQVKLTVVGSGCSLGGHFGRIYVDGAGRPFPARTRPRAHPPPSTAAALSSIRFTMPTAAPPTRSARTST